MTGRDDHDVAGPRFEQNIVRASPFRTLYAVRTTTWHLASFREWEGPPKRTYVSTVKGFTLLFS